MTYNYENCPIEKRLGNAERWLEQMPSGWRIRFSKYKSKGTTKWMAYFYYLNRRIDLASLIIHYVPPPEGPAPYYITSSIQMQQAWRKAKDEISLS